jgi:alpha-beta hydrolase superfamily lysophospholipase
MRAEASQTGAIRRRLASMVLGGLGLLTAGCTPALVAAQVPDRPAAAVHTAEAPRATDCPGFLPATVRCHTGTSLAGAPYIVAKPADWNGALILFAHGGPRLGPPQLSETIEDLEKFQMLVDEGYAWAGTTYRRGGYGVRSAADDMDDLREIVWGAFGRPPVTLLHGQSWGANVAAKYAELHALDTNGRANIDGVILTSGVLAGGTRAYRLRSDLRAVYQYYCQNHPRPEEPQYPLWQGLPVGATMSRSDLAARVQECTGIGQPEAGRTDAQRARARNITAVLGIGEAQILPNLVWATMTFQDMIARLGGRNPFSNRDTIYRGSDDDEALNAGIERFAADPAAVAQLAYDSDLSGLIVVPTITLHGAGDLVASAAHAAAYRETVARAGRSHLLVQVYTAESEHSRLSAPAYPAVFAAMMDWIRAGRTPAPAGIAEACQAFATVHREPCLFLPDFTPPTGF